MENDGLRKYGWIGVETITQRLQLAFPGEKPWVDLIRLFVFLLQFLFLFRFFCIDYTSLLFVLRMVRERQEFEIELFAIHSWSFYGAKKDTKVYLLPEDAEPKCTWLNGDELNESLTPLNKGAYIYLREVESKTSSTHAFFEFLHPFRLTTITGATALTVANKKDALLSCLDYGFFTIEDIVQAASDEAKFTQRMVNECANIHKGSLATHVHASSMNFPNGVLEIILQYMTAVKGDNTRGTLNICKI
jgi:hypothetical protein